MVVPVVLVLSMIVIHTIVEGLKTAKERKNWIYGHEYILDPLNIWVIAKAVGDPKEEEFEVKWNVCDGHFYDRNKSGYSCNEIKIKRNGVL